MEVLPFGDQALLVNFEQLIQVEVNRKVMALYRALRKGDFPEVTYLIPAYCSLVVGYDPNISGYRKLRKQLLALKFDPDRDSEPPRKLRIPVCYHPSYGIDLKAVAAETKLKPAEIVELHTSHTYRVFMLGFLPGFAYMGPLPEALHCSRKSTPRKKVSQGSVGLAGNQTGIYPDDAPGGWKLIGKSPLPIFRPLADQPFLFQVGDLVQFEAIEESQFRDLQLQCENATFNWASVYEA